MIAEIGTVTHNYEDYAHKTLALTCHGDILISDWLASRGIRGSANAPYSTADCLFDGVEYNGSSAVLGAFR